MTRSRPFKVNRRRPLPAVSMLHAIDGVMTLALCPRYVHSRLTTKDRCGRYKIIINNNSNDNTYMAPQLVE